METDRKINTAHYGSGLSAWAHIPRILSPNLRCATKVHKFNPMAYIKFPILFAKDEDEKWESMGIKPKNSEDDMNPGEIYINTLQICAFNEMDNGDVLVRMSNGECYQLPVDIEEFADIVVDLIVEFPLVSNN